MNLFKEILSTYYSRDPQPHLSFEKLPSYLSQNEIEIMNEFFVKLFQTKDFKNELTKIKKILILNQILKKAFREEPFCKSIFLPLCFEAIESCEDRIAITFNRMALELKLQDRDIKARPTALADLLIGYVKLQHLYEESMKYCQKKGLQDHIEVSLFLETRLSKDLSLPTFTSEMNFPQSGHVSKKERKNIRNKIFSATRTPAQWCQLLTTPLKPSYTKEGKILHFGRISPTNPYHQDVSDIWKRQLKSMFPEKFQEIELRDDELLDPKALLAYQNREQKLLQSISEKIFNSEKRKTNQIL